MLRPLGISCLVLLAACVVPQESSTPIEAEATATELPAVPAEPTRFLPDAWSSQAPWDFEQSVARLVPGTWSIEDRTTLGSALKRPDQVSIRAAVLLGFGGIDSAHVILSYLEERIEEPAREADAAEVVATRALARFPEDSIRERLRLLAVGGIPHPDLEIRTECACVALEMGERQVIPFLLRVLHAGTPAQLTDPIDWSPKQTLAWSKGRAAASLSRVAGVPNEFQADGPWAAQNAQAQALAEALAQGPQGASSKRNENGQKAGN